MDAVVRKTDPPHLTGGSFFCRAWVLRSIPRSASKDRCLSGNYAISNISVPFLYWQFEKVSPHGGDRMREFFFARWSPPIACGDAPPILKTLNGKTNLFSKNKFVSRSPRQKRKIGFTVFPFALASSPAARLKRGTDAAARIMVTPLWCKGGGKRPKKRGRSPLNAQKKSVCFFARGVDRISARVFWSSRRRDRRSIIEGLPPHTPPQGGKIVAMTLLITPLVKGGTEKSLIFQGGFLRDDARGFRRGGACSSRVR